MKDSYCLDACALIAFLCDEPGADVVEQLLIEAERKNISLIMHRINLLEVYYGIEKSEGKSRADEILKSIYDLPITFIDKINDRIFFTASYFKSNYRLSLADAIALATSKTRKAKLVSSDHHEFDVLERNNEINIKWIR